MFPTLRVSLALRGLNLLTQLVCKEKYCLNYTKNVLRDHLRSAGFLLKEKKTICSVFVFTPSVDCIGAVFCELLFASILLLSCLLCYKDLSAFTFFTFSSCNKYLVDLGMGTARQGEQ